MTDREFWREFRRGLLTIVAAIERGKLGEQQSLPPIKKAGVAMTIQEMSKKAEAFVKAHPEVVRHGKYESSGDCEEVGRGG